MIQDCSHEIRIQGTRARMVRDPVMYRSLNSESHLVPCPAEPSTLIDRLSPRAPAQAAAAAAEQQEAAEGMCGQQNKSSAKLLPPIFDCAMDEVEVFHMSMIALSA
mmetsp:Transcript_10206/g.29282  ORF Transcript_10206/g.29282 Transcript_10206/m.29282 type:complete len:106 (-) Transcript_10206:233-550(-)